MSLGRFTLGALVGGAIGAAVGMLLAPRSGAETREMIKEELAARYNEGAQDLQAISEKVTEKVTDKSKAVSDKIKQVTAELEEVGRQTVSKLNT